MRFKRSLRYRVGLAFALFGGLVSLLLAMGLSFSVRDLERHLLDEALTAELQDYMARRARNPNSPPSPLRPPPRPSSLTGSAWTLPANPCSMI